MAVVVNDKAYEYAGEMTIFAFLQKNDIFIPSNKSLTNDYIDEFCYVEIKDEQKLINAKTNMLVDGMIIYTNSKKVYDYLYNYINSSTTNFEVEQITLDTTDYNILLCDEELYDSCIEKFTNTAFNDIINLRIGKMIYLVEIAHQIMLYLSEKLEKKILPKMIVNKCELINYPKKNQLNLKSEAEILAKLIKTYYKKHLHIEQNINIIYVTSSKDIYLSSQVNQSSFENDIDKTCYYSSMVINDDIPCLDQKITNSIYIKKTSNDIKCNYKDLFKILNAMGIKEKTLEISNSDEGKVIILTYEKVVLKILFTSFFLTMTEIEALDCDIIFITSFDNEYNGIVDIMTDYNLNYIYKKILLYPSSSDIFRRF